MREWRLAIAPEFGSVNEAMAAAVDKARADWRAFVKEWEADERDE